MTTHERTNYTSGSHWEPLRAYSRAVAVGDTLYISGTNAIDAHGGVVSPGDAYAQTKYALESIKKILHQTGFHINNVVRTRLYVTSMSDWDDYAQAHREAFEKIRPASSVVQVERLIDPRLLVEIEVDAIRGTSPAQLVSLPKN